jgi:hypothetical protein
VGSLFQVYLDGTAIPDNINGSCAIWGPGAIDTLGRVRNRSGASYASLMLLKGGITIDGSAFGTQYNNGAFTAGRAITPANIDLYGGLQNPETGDRYC